MGTNSSTTFATRLPVEEAKLVEAVLSETDQQPAELLRTALRYYMRENPDQIVALCPEKSLEAFWAEMCNGAKRRPRDRRAPRPVRVRLDRARCLGAAPMDARP